MKQFRLSFLIVVLLCMLTNSLFAHDIEVQNADGVTIYYSWIKNKTELAVTYRSTDYFSRAYSGKVIIPECIEYESFTYRVTSIGDSAFDSCNGLTTVVIPNSVTCIGDHAFSFCSGLTFITIPNSVTSIGYGAFDYCISLKIVIIKDIAAWCGIKFGDYSSNPLFYAEHLYSDEDTEITNMVIPNNVMSIEEHAFQNCSGLSSVTFGNSVTSIGSEAFSGCSGLTTITFPNSVTNIGKYAFSGCHGLTSITIGDNVKSIGDNAFYSCVSLTSITIPKNVTNIENGAFSYCSGLTSITVDMNNTIYDSRGNCNAIIETGTNTLIAGCKNTIIPNNVTSIGKVAFAGCSSLTSVIIPNSVTNIGENAFKLCSGLTTITIPNSVTNIGSSAFLRCSALTSVTIGNSVTNIGSKAFNCENLTTVVSLIENPFEIYGNLSNGGTFSQNTFMNAMLYVPTGKMEVYKATEGWKDFANIVEGTPTGVTNITLDKETTNAPVYDLNGRRLTEPQKGINIIGGKKVLNH